ncbi:hypothetical protein [Novosphingobium aquimarinum]|uniref:hypothetical protein n=1 Tax=Novosphingobium aquimarinum TaxID=2682494 RepID=UPI0012EC3486|nr:hypothetical protein [Novosphingobium aquimarinum]
MRRSPNHATAPRAATLATILALALSACGGEAPTDTATETPDTAMMASEAADPAGIASTEASAIDAAATTPAEDGQPAARETLTCSSQRGEGTAWQLARTCREVSPATHPPCNPLNSCAMIEGEIARSCAVFDDGEGLLPDACTPPPRSAAAAVAAVKRYYDAIGAHDLGTAWQAWGPDGNPEQTFEEFQKGYAQTASTSVKTGKPGRVEGAAGSLYVEVPVTVEATLENGRKQRFTGKYVLRQPNRGMGRSQGWHITSATLEPAAAEKPNG